MMRNAIMRNLPAFQLILTLLFVSRLTAATYYFDATQGNDQANGLSPQSAWKTLEKFNATTFQPGDRILFKAGGVWNGQLVPKGSGNLTPDGNPNLITLSQYGTGSLPRIEATGRFSDAVLLRNVHYWEISDLEVTNQGSQPGPWRTGVHISADGIGTMRHLILRRLIVRDVNGSLRKSEEGCGIYFDSKGPNDTSFNGILIEKCHVLRTDRNGICQRSGRGPLSRNIIIRDNLLEDIGGDGIKLWGSQGGLIERNRIRGARMRCTHDEAAAGIWPFASDDTVIQFNEVTGVRGTKDGQAYDADYGCRRTLFQYNYSYRNEGGFMLICGPGGSRNDDTIIRYNISVHDGINSARVFHFGGTANRTHIYNNTIILSPTQNLPLILGTDWSGGFARETTFSNNLFLVAEGGRATYQFGPTRDNRFETNLFVGRHEGLPSGVEVTTRFPIFRGPLTPTPTAKELTDFRPSDSRNFPRGTVIQNNGGRDFFGKPLPANRPPAIGAIEP